MIINYFNCWKLKKWQSNLLHTLLWLIYPAKIQKGDKIRCYGISYPQWKGDKFECTANFKDKTIGIRNAIRVAKKDFRKLGK